MDSEEDIIEVIHDRNYRTLAEAFSELRSQSELYKKLFQEAAAQRDEALATRDAALSKISEMRAMWIDDVKMLQDRNGILLNQCDELKEMCRNDDVVRSQLIIENGTLKEQLEIAMFEREKARAIVRRLRRKRRAQKRICPACNGTGKVTKRTENR